MNLETGEIYLEVGDEITSDFLEGTEALKIMSIETLAIDHVNVGYRISDTAPKSLRTYRTVSNAPAEMAGRSAGNVTRRKERTAPKPNTRALSSRD